MVQTSNQTLRSLTWNVENLFLFLEKWNGRSFENLNEIEWQNLTTAVSKNKPLRKVRWIANTINDVQPNLIMLSEVGGIESLENFNRYFLNDQYRPFLIEGNSDRGIDVGYLVRKDVPGRFLLISHRERRINFWYPHEDSQKTSSHKFSRDVAELRWFSEGRQTPDRIFLLVHLKSKLDAKNQDANGFLRRSAELASLVELYKEIREECPVTPIIVAGDFNAFSHATKMAPEFEPLYQKTDLIEIFDWLKKPIEQCATQVNVYSNVRQLIKIDHFFISPELKEKIVVPQTFIHRFKDDSQQMMEYATTYEQRLALPSDHYPIVCEITDFWTSCP